MIHKVARDSNNEYYIIKSSLEDQKRVLTIRTQNVLINKTDAEYKICIFTIDKGQEKVNKLYEVTL